ncbi:MAG: MTH865 family protein [Alphaproteobacteria bacterium]|uniref:MTH865 family protein n=1 Tax=Candidatus Nitrobium versatile TaxID=2884831 RepID=A0A953J6K9_9BACT|nr:MTH865 family protein [Candidatus Nitrobium versatile]
MSVRETIRGQIIGALQGATFPIGSPEALLAAFPDGANTTCRAEGIEVTAGQAGGLLVPGDFPFKSAEEVAETIVSRANL